ncbi:MAG: hypothetical protein JOZ51_13265, partial [Chloroflexi bacterium]|nr:hypothetical protein [Chloroflexota bacterium]
MRTWMMFLLVVAGLIVHTNVAAVAHAYSGPQSDAVFQSRPLISELTVTGERDESDKVIFDEIGVPVQILNLEKDELYAVGTVVGGVSQGASIARISIAPCTDGATGDDSVRLVCLALTELTEAGTYTGAIDITNNSDAGDSIAVTAVVPDADTPTAAMISGDLVARARHSPVTRESALQPIDVYVRTSDESVLFPVGAVVGSIGGPGPAVRVTRAACSSSSPVASTAATLTALPTQDQENPTQSVEETLVPEPSQADTTPTAQTDDVKRVCLSAQGLSTVGTYTGPVDVTDNDTDDHVSLSITVADGLGWAILAAIGGVLLYSLIGLGYNYVASSWLSERANKLEKQICNQKTQDQKTQDQKTQDQKTQDQKTQDQKTQDQKTQDQKTQDQKTQDQKLQ